MTAHAKNRPPSSAKRWLSCPYSSQIVAMYDRDETDQSLKGDYWHELMEVKLVFGTLPLSTDPDAAEYIEELADYVAKRVHEMGGFPKVKMFVEARLDIPETGEFGTVDVLLVSEREIEVIDLKSGYVVVHIKMNPQLLIYLLGAIAAHGERKRYKITIYQPNYHHAEGPFRSYDPTDEDLDWLRGEIAYSIANPDECKAGKHCKETYCDHRGACEPFMAYVQQDLRLGWHSSEVKAMSDDALATALDAAEELSGWRNVLRAEGMRRIINMDREIHGYKVVKAKKQRAVLKPLELVNAVYSNMGSDWAIRLFNDIDEYLSVEDFPMQPDAKALKFLGTPKHIEDVIKQYARDASLPRGGWKLVYDNVVGEYIRETNNGLTLEKAIDGRPAHKRGSEFGSLVPAPNQAVTII